MQYEYAMANYEYDLGAVGDPCTRAKGKSGYLDANGNCIGSKDLALASVSTMSAGGGGILPILLLGGAAVGIVLFIRSRKKGKKRR